MTREFKVTTMTKQDAINLGLMNVDTWHGAKNEFIVATISEMLGMPPFMMDPPIYVVTSKDNYLGAAVLAHTDIIEKIATELDSDLIIIPSSIHEILIIKESDSPTDGNGLTDMIGGVNGSLVDHAERLGDEPLYYKRGSFKITSKKAKRDEAVDTMVHIFNGIS